MIDLGRLRQRLPLVAFILLAILVVMLVGFACACITDHPIQAIERALSAIPALPALVEVWSYAAAATATLMAVLAWPAVASRRASPAVLQRFLF